MPFSCIGNKADPMAFVLKKYREYLIERALQVLVAPGARDTEKTVKKTYTSDVLKYVNLLFESVTKEVTTINSLTSLESKFEVIF